MEKDQNQTDKHEGKGWKEILREVMGKEARKGGKEGGDNNGGGNRVT